MLQASPKMYPQHQHSSSDLQAPAPTLDRLQRSPSPRRAIPSSYSIPGPMPSDPTNNDTYPSGYFNASHDVSPSPDVHPANFAPFADETLPREQTATPGTIAPSSRHTPVPQSPGPVPTKAEVQEESRPAQRNHGLTIVAPDSHPLAHPQSKGAASSGMYTPTFSPGTRPGGKDLLANHNPGQIMHPNQQITGGTWKYGLCECTDIGVCCLGFWCPCILYGKTQYRLSRKSDKKDPTNLLGYEAFNAPCTMMGILCGFQCMCSFYNFHREIYFPG